jgi:hypothetical protein
MKILLLVLKNFFIVYTTAWAFISAFGISRSILPDGYNWPLQFAHIIVALILALIISLDNILLVSKNHKGSSIQKQFNGKWKSEIFDRNGNLVKSDIWDFVTEKENRVSGKIKRILPDADRAREWFFSGYLVPDQMQVAFTQTDMTGRSRGCAILKKTLATDSVFKGFYYKLDDNGNADEVQITLTKVKRKH